MNATNQVLATRPTRALIGLLAAAAGIAVANLYYAQPLAPVIGRSLNASDRAVGIALTFTQIGYALGMLMLVPLGDARERRGLLSLTAAAAVPALLLVAAAPSVAALAVFNLFLGAASSLPQLTVPFAVGLLPTEERGRALGPVMGGLLTGILLSRTVSGWLGHAIGCGLLPGFRPDQIHVVGNTSLGGAFLALCDRSLLGEMQTASTRMEAVELFADARSYAFSGPASAKLASSPAAPAPDSAGHPLASSSSGGASLLRYAVPLGAGRSFAVLSLRLPEGLDKADIEALVVETVDRPMVRWPSDQGKNRECFGCTFDTAVGRSRLQAGEGDWMDTKSLLVVIQWNGNKREVLNTYPVLSLPLGD